MEEGRLWKMEDMGISLGGNQILEALGGKSGLFRRDC